MLQDLVCVPPPQLAEHEDQLDQPPSTGQLLFEGTDGVLAEHDPLHLYVPYVVFVMPQELDADSLEHESPAYETQYEHEPSSTFADES